MKNAAEIREMELENVNGGTFMPNRYSEEQYNACGIKTNYRFLLADEFTLPDGSHTDETGANEYIKVHFPDVYREKEEEIQRFKDAISRASRGGY